MDNVQICHILVICVIFFHCQRFTGILRSQQTLGGGDPQTFVENSFEGGSVVLERPNTHSAITPVGPGLPANIEHGHFHTVVRDLIARGQGFCSKSVVRQAFASSGWTRLLGAFYSSSKKRT